MKLIVGLGNPGKKYQETRHNLGFKVLDGLASSVERPRLQSPDLPETLRVSKRAGATADGGQVASSWKKEERFRAEVCRVSEDVLLAKPLTFMNNSGLVVSLIINYFKIKPEDIWVIHDDIDLPLGSIRIRLGGSSAGHRGVESIIKSLGTDKFWRYRLGIEDQSSKLKVQSSKLAKQKLKNVEEFVLEEFTKEEKGRVKELINRTEKAIEFALENGLEKAMNKFNVK